MVIMCRLLWSKRSFPQQLLSKGGVVHTAPVPHPEGFTHHVYLLPRIDHCSARSAAACRHTDSDVTSSRPGISSHEKFAHGSRSP